jgi:hypothetical protein
MKHPDNASYGISCFPGLKHWCGTFQQSSKARAPYIYSDNAFLGGRVDDHGVPAFHTPAHNHPRAHCTNGLQSRLLGMIPGACHLSEPVIYIDCGQDSCWAIRLPAEHDPRRTLLRDFVPQRSWVRFGAATSDARVMFAMYVNTGSLCASSCMLDCT